MQMGTEVTQDGAGLYEKSLDEVRAKLRKAESRLQENQDRLKHGIYDEEEEAAYLRDKQYNDSRIKHINDKMTGLEDPEVVKSFGVDLSMYNWRWTTEDLVGKIYSKYISPYLCKDSTVSSPSNGFGIHMTRKSAERFLQDFGRKLPNHIIELEFERVGKVYICVENLPEIRKEDYLGKWTYLDVMQDKVNSLKSKLERLERKNSKYNQMFSNIVD